jgi:hypothetical protein
LKLAHEFSGGFSHIKEALEKQGHFIKGTFKKA